MKATFALGFAVAALLVALSGVSSSMAVPAGWLDGCVVKVQHMRRVGVTIDGRYRWVWVAGPDRAAAVAEPRMIAVPVVEPSCLTP